MAEGGVAGDGAGCGKESADFAGEAAGVQEDGLAEDNIGDHGGDDVGDIYSLAMLYPIHFVTLQASVVGYIHVSGCNELGGSRSGHTRNEQTQSVDGII